MYDCVMIAKIGMKLIVRIVIIIALTAPVVVRVQMTSAGKLLLKKSMAHSKMIA